MLCIITEFTLRVTLPEFGRRSSIGSCGAIGSLFPSFAYMVDRYPWLIRDLGLSESKVAYRVSMAASFLLVTQEADRTSLSEVMRQGVFSRMAGNDGFSAFSATRTKILVSVLTSDRARPRLLRWPH